jgi:two-component system OmpR family sensor kinase/two-component system sensor histidine kinase BaeS
MFRRFFFLFGLLMLFLLVALGASLALLLRPLAESLPRPEVLLLVVCGLPLVFFSLAGMLGRWAFRRFGSPLVELISAADAVAEGDLSVRVRENVPGEMGRLTSSFNRMASGLERAEQQRRSLTADVAHELRTPLHVIQGNLEGVLDGVYQPTPEHIAATLEETRLLARLVSDLQTLSLAEAGALPLHPTRLLAVDLLQNAAASFAGAAAAAGLEIVVETGDSAGDLALEGDPDRLDQVLSNLVANALRHTPPGGRITLRAGSLPAEGEAEGVRLEVVDTGAGIAPEDLPFIYDRFWRGDRSRTRQAGAGSGLGLAIARQLVQAHGGRITASSQPGQGAAFTIDLPRRAPGSVDQHQPGL